MSAYGVDDRLNESKQSFIWFWEKTVTVISNMRLIDVVGVIIALFIGGVVIFAFRDFLLNLWSEAISIIFTVGVLEVLARQREQKALVDQLMRQVHYPAHSVAVNALSELHSMGKLEGDDGLLVKGGFSELDWHGVDLPHVNLSEAYFWKATLSNINLTDANLTQTNFQEADISEAILWRVDLSDSILRQAILTNTTLMNAQLWGADLTGANLTEADIEGVHFSGATLTDAILPDGTTYEIGRNLVREFGAASNP